MKVIVRPERVVKIHVHAVLAFTNVNVCLYEANNTSSLQESYSTQVVIRNDAVILHMRRQSKHELLPENYSNTTMLVPFIKQLEKSWNITLSNVRYFVNEQNAKVPSGAIKAKAPVAFI